MGQLQQVITSLEEYTDLVRIHTSDKIIVYRALRKIDQKPVILKTLRSDTPKPEHLEALEQEFTLLQHLKGVLGVNQVYELLTQPNLILVKEDQGALSLKEYLAGQPLTLEPFLQIAIQITDVLGEIHGKHVIHKDINPSNLIIKPESGEIQFIDFSLASQLDEETQEEISPNFLEGTLAYIAPERTGRMNRPIDYRSDFYSLGVTFYEMLARKLPFESKDPLEIIHDHISKLPPPLPPTIPSTLAQLIAKLMAKNPDDRYSSTFGIKADLIKCQKALEFIPGENDALDCFLISHKLYGRDEQIQEILESYKKVSQGASQLLLVSGYSGIGKTSIVREVHKPMTREKGIFISGKFDQLQRNTPYYGFVQAFTTLIHQQLSEPEEKVTLVRKEILEALSINAQVLIDVIPDLELLIGKQPSVSLLASQEAQIRFILTFQNFVHVFAKEGHPCIIFLDDLQWADSGSLKLLEVLLTDTSLKYLFMIGAYRDNEVDVHHPFMMTVEDLQKAGVDIHKIVLKPLIHSDISQLLIDSFPTRTFEAVDFTQAIYEKTQGNPFFINEFLKLLYNEHILTFNYSKLAWDVHQEKIAALGITDNVVDLMIQKIQKLPPATIELLKIAACIGHTFDLQTLAVVSEKSPPLIESELWEALHAGLITGENYQKIALGSEFDVWARKKVDYKFLHDRIQQAAYTLIPSETRQQQQLTIGRLLLKEYQKNRHVDLLPNIMNHFNECLALVTEKSEKHELATLYLQVGKAAKNATAYQAALKFFDAGVSLLDPPDWERDYPLLFELAQEKAEGEYLTGKLDVAEKQFLQLLDRARDKFDKTKIAHMMMPMYVNMGKLDLATKTGLDSLKLFNIYLNEKPSKFQLSLEFIKIKWFLRNKKIEDFDQVLKPMTDPGLLLVCKTLIKLIACTYSKNNKLYALVALKHLKLLLFHGYSNYSPVGLGHSSIIFMSRNEIEIGLNLVKLGDKLNEVVTAETKNIYVFGVGSLVNHFKNPMSNSINMLNTGYKLSMESGDLVFAYYSIFYKSLTLLNAGRPLDMVSSDFKKTMDFSSKIKLKDQIVPTFLKLIMYLQGAIQISHLEIDKLAMHKTRKGNKLSDALFLVTAFELSFFNNDSPKVLEFGKEFYVNYQRYLVNMYALSHYLVIYALGIFDCYAKDPSLIKRDHWKHLKKIIKQINNWGEKCPVNYVHQSLLLQAEMARLNNREERALQLYDQAIEAATIHEFTQFVAIINERVANHFLQHGKPKLAKPYIQEAYNYYLRWGAKVKAQELEQKYPQWLTETTSSSTTTTGSTNLDLLSISKATQAISEEILLERLLTRITQIVLENAAAQRVVILQNQPLLILAEGTREVVQVPEDRAPTAEELPLSIISYVQRTKTTVVLGDASKQPEQFAQDPYLANNQIKSVLCAPIAYRANITGILYLENNLLAHAFTSERLKVLNILSSQASISLENARLYAATERFVPTQFIQVLGKRGITDVHLRDQVQCSMTVLFCDIRNFTQMSESMTSKQVYDILNDFLEIMEPIITKHKGFIDKYIGDAIMALFPDEATDEALNAAVEMIQNVPPSLRIGIGINSGDLMLGILGAKKRIEGSVIGDTVNIASRVETLTKTYDVPLLITEDTKNRLIRPLDHVLRRIESAVSVKGKTLTFPIWEVCDADPPEVKAAKVQTLNQFIQALQALSEKKPDLAKKIFENILAKNPRDTVAAYYLKKL